MIKCVVIDDQKSAVEVIVNHITKKAELQLIETFTDPLEALRFLEKQDIDLVFTDMEMPHISGIELMKGLLLKKGVAIPKFIFITGHNNYALSCFDLGVKDYLLKPVSFSRFNTAVDRLMVDTFQTTAKGIKNRFFFADVDGGKAKVNLNDIVYIESSGNYVKIVGNKTKLITHRSLNSIQEILPPEDFIRVHKSYIVSINFIESYKAGKLGFSINNSVIKIPTGDRFRGDVLKRLQVT